MGVWFFVNVIVALILQGAFAGTMAIDTLGNGPLIIQIQYPDFDKACSGNYAIQGYIYKNNSCNGIGNTQLRHLEIVSENLVNKTKWSLSPCRGIISGFELYTVGDCQETTDDRYGYVRYQRIFIAQNVSEVVDIIKELNLQIIGYNYYYNGVCNNHAYSTFYIVGHCGWDYVYPSYVCDNSADKFIALLDDNGDIIFGMYNNYYCNGTALRNCSVSLGGCNGIGLNGYISWWSETFPGISTNAITDLSASLNTELSTGQSINPSLNTNTQVTQATQATQVTQGTSKSSIPISGTTIQTVASTMLILLSTVPSIMTIISTPGGIQNEKNAFIVISAVVIALIIGF